MSKKDRRYNHSRYMGHSGHYFERQLDFEKSLPTDKQRKFLKHLQRLCKDNGISADLKDENGTCLMDGTRTGFSSCIDLLINRLNENGIEAGGNGKAFINTIVLEDTHSTLDIEVKERLEPLDEENEQCIQEAIKAFDEIAEKRKERAVKPVQFPQPVSKEEEIQETLKAVNVKVGDTWYRVVHFVRRPWYNQYGGHPALNKYIVEPMKIRYISLLADGNAVLYNDTRSAIFYQLPKEQFANPKKAVWLKKGEPLYKSEKTAQKVCAKLNERLAQRQGQ